MTTAMYAISGDPITYGHIDIIKRTSKYFNKLVVGIGVNPNKKYMFNLDERKNIAQKALSQFSNVEIISFPGLLVDYVYENNIDLIVRGVRNAADFAFEYDLHQGGTSQKLDSETVLFLAKPELAHVSSSMVKAIQTEQGLIHEYVPPYIKQCLEARISGQYIVGVTGEIGTGKSYVSQKFIEIGKSRGIEVHNIELDHIGHQILGELTEPKYDAVRKEIAKTFGEKVRKADGSIDRQILGEAVFGNTCELEKLNNIMETPLLLRLRRELYGKKGLILFNAALIAESNMSYLCNNNVVLIYADKKTQEERLRLRGLNHKQILRRLESQFDFEKKKSSLEEAITKDNHGQIFVLDTSNGKNEIETVFDKVISNNVASELKITK